MKRLFVSLVFAVAAASLVLAGCTQAAPAPAPTAAPKAAEPTKAPAPPTKAAEPTKAAAQAPTAAPAKKVDFPTKGSTITMIVPWAAGGNSDIGTRLVASGMEKELGVNVVVVNKPGASSQIGLTELAQAKPDGYTLAHTNTPSLFTTYMDPQRKAAYTFKSFQPIAQYGGDTTLVTVKADHPFKSIKDLVDTAKAQPKKVRAGSSGQLGLTHFAALKLEKAAGVQFAIVHLDGGARQVTALLGGNIDFALASKGNITPHFQSGAARVLAIMGEREHKAFPGVKTLESQGYKIYSASTHGIAAPAGTPKEVVDILSGAVKKAMENPDIAKRLEEIALDVQYRDAAQFSALLKEMEGETPQLMELAK